MDEGFFLKRWQTDSKGVTTETSRRFIQTPRLLDACFHQKKSREKGKGCVVYYWWSRGQGRGSVVGMASLFFLQNWLTWCGAKALRAVTKSVVGRLKQENLVEICTGTTPRGGAKPRSVDPLGRRNLAAGSMLKSGSTKTRCRWRHSEVGAAAAGGGGG